MQVEEFAHRQPRQLRRLAAAVEAVLAVAQRRLLAVDEMVAAAAAAAAAAVAMRHGMQPDHAGVRRQRAGGQFQQRGLAGAVVAAQPADAGAEFQVELAEQRPRRVLKVQLADVQHGRQFHSSLPMAVRVRMAPTTMPTRPRALIWRGAMVAICASAAAHSQTIAVLLLRPAALLALACSISAAKPASTAAAGNRPKAAAVKNSRAERIGHDAMMGRSSAVCSRTAWSPRSVNTISSRLDKAPHSAGGTGAGCQRHVATLASAPSNSRLCCMPTALSARQNGSQKS